MNVSVIIPVKNDPRLFACVDSILALRDEVPAAQVLVVDDCSSVEFRASLEGLPKGTTLMTSSGAGVYAARNQGVRFATGDLLMFTDADCVIRPGWLREAVAGIVGGADLVQGFSGSVEQSVGARLMQARYEAHFRRVRPGGATETDTRNLAVRREVFDTLSFDEDFRRVGDTEFGLMAERAGFKVVYRPEMRVDHAHDRDFRLFAAKQVCHGWGAQRLMHENSDLRWHGGLMRPVSLGIERLARVPGRTLVGQALARISIAAGGGVQATAARMPFRVSLTALMLVDKFAGLAGHLLFTADGHEPSPSELLHRRVPRD